MTHLENSIQSFKSKLDPAREEPASSKTFLKVHRNKKEREKKVYWT